MARKKIRGKAGVKFKSPYTSEKRDSQLRTLVTHLIINEEVKVVEKMQKEEGLTKADITREQFLERAWAWTNEYGGTIQNQQRKSYIEEWQKLQASELNKDEKSQDMGYII